MIHFKKYCQLCLGLFLAVAMSANAEEWKYEFTPYLWASDMAVTAGKNGKDFSSGDIPFHDTLDRLDAGWMSKFEARNGNWGVMNDIIWMKISDGGSKQFGPLGGSTFKGTVKMQQGFVDLAAGYTPDNSNTTIYGGFRYIYILVDVAASVTLPPPGSLLEAGRTEQLNWTNPLVGVRQVVPVTEKLSAVGQVDVAGLEDEMSYMATATLKYAFTDTLNASFGYRYNRVRMNSDDVLFDQTGKGFMAMVGFKF